MVVFESYSESFLKNQIAQALKPFIVHTGIWGSVRTLARGYEIIIGLVLFTPVAFLAWFPFVSEFQTRMLFNQAFSRGLQISRILGGPKKDRSSSNKEWRLSKLCVLEVAASTVHIRYLSTCFAVTRSCVYSCLYVWLR